MCVCACFPNKKQSVVSSLQTDKSYSQNCFCSFETEVTTDVNRHEKKAMAMLLDRDAC